LLIRKKNSIGRCLGKINFSVKQVIENFRSPSTKTEGSHLRLATKLKTGSKMHIPQSMVFSICNIKDIFL
jgi:hypothetical protein